MPLIAFPSAISRASGCLAADAELLGSNAAPRRRIRCGYQEGRDAVQHGVAQAIELRDTQPLRRVRQLGGRNLKQISAGDGDRVHRSSACICEIGGNSPKIAIGGCQAGELLCCGDCRREGEYALVRGRHADYGRLIQYHPGGGDSLLQ